MNLFSLLLSLSVFSCSCYAVTGSTSFDTQTLAFSNFKFLGDAHVFNGSFRLSRDISSPNSGAGGILYREAIRFRRSASRIPVSFSTRFTLSIHNSNKDCPGGGAAFVISPDDDAIGSSGGNLGVPSGAVAVEFDTQMDVEFQDINANHIGFNLDSMISYKAVNLDLFKVDLKSGRPLKVWIDFSGVTGKLKIYITYRDTKPKLPVLSASLNMSRYVNDYMYVGFTASTQGSTESHSIEGWNFRSSFGDASTNSSHSKPKSIWSVVGALVVACLGLGYGIRIYLKNGNNECCNDSCNCCF